MNDLRAAAQQALEALEKSRVFVTTREKIKHPEGTEWYDERITALRTALAQQQEQEPVAHYYAKHLAIAIWEKHYKDTAPDWTPLPDLMGVLTQIDNMTVGLAPPRREWQGLTEEEIDRWTPEIHPVIRAIEAALKEKNHD
jgi:hypothetical protein